MKINSVLDLLTKWVNSPEKFTVVIKKKEGAPNVVAEISKTNYYYNESDIEKEEIDKKLKKLKI